MSRSENPFNESSIQNSTSLLNPDRDYRGLKVVQFHALNLFNHFMSEDNLNPVIQRYVGPECYFRNQSVITGHNQRLRLVYDRWSGTEREDLFYSLIDVEKTELTANSTDTFISAANIGHELFANGQLDYVVGFNTADYQDFQKNVTAYLLQQLCRVYFLNPEVRTGAATKRRFDTDEGRARGLQNLGKARLIRGLLPYSEEDMQTLIQLWSTEVPRKEIAASIGRTEGSIQFWLGKLDLPHRLDTRNWTDEEIADTIRLRTERHLTFAQIGEILVRSEKSIHHKLIEKGIISFHRKTWDTEEFQRLQGLLTTEYSWITIQQELENDFPRGRTPKEVQAKARHSELRLKTEFEVKRAQLEQLLADGLKEKVIAEKLGIAEGTVGKWKRRLKAKRLQENP
jgi:hypothetical protein